MSQNRKSRRVCLLVELDTDVPLKDLKKPGNVEVTLHTDGIRTSLPTLQVQANVIRPEQKRR